MRMSPQEPSATRWINGIVTPAETGAVRLFCFPHAGGGASVFRSWMPQLVPGIEVYPIQLPGREGRWLEPRVTRASDLIQTLIEELGPLFRPPFAFFGHSMGAFIAFELARELRRSWGPQPDVLILSGARAPHVADPDPPMHQLPDDLLLEELKRLDGIPAELLEEPEIVSMMLPTLRADLTMCETYEYRTEQPLDCSISVYGGDSDGKIHLEHLIPWEIHTARGFQLRIFPGNHFFFVKDSQVTVREALCDDLRPHIKQVKQVNQAPQRVQLEQVIARVWADLLRLPQVGIDDNFFDLGANSLLVIQAHGKLQEASITLSVLDLFQYPTVRLLASAVGDSPTGFGK